MTRRHDEVLAATRRYRLMAERDSRHALPARAWSAIAARLAAASDLVSGDNRVFVAARSRDAGHRAVHAASFGEAAS